MTGLLAATYTTTYSTKTLDLSPAVLVTLGLLVLALVAFMIVAMVRVFKKAGKPGWAAIVPVYNSWILAEIAGKPGWWGLYVLLAWIPVVGTILALIIGVMIALGVARNFGKSNVFGVVGLFLFSIVGYPMLAFGGARYKAGTGAAGAMPEGQASVAAPAAASQDTMPQDITTQNGAPQQPSQDSSQPTPPSASSMS